VFDLDQERTPVDCRSLRHRYFLTRFDRAPARRRSGERPRRAFPRQHVDPHRSPTLSPVFTGTGLTMLAASTTKTTSAPSRLTMASGVSAGTGLRSSGLQRTRQESDLVLMSGSTRASRFDEPDFYQQRALLRSTVARCDSLRDRRRSGKASTGSRPAARRDLPIEDSGHIGLNLERLHVGHRDDRTGGPEADETRDDVPDVGALGGARCR